MKLRNIALSSAMMTLTVLLGVTLSKGVPAVAADLQSPPLATVRTVCESEKNDLKLDAWVYQSGYLVCSVSDENTSGGGLYKQNADGSYTFVIGDGGVLTAQDFIEAGVPTDTANDLFRKMNVEYAKVPICDYQRKQN